MSGGFQGFAGIASQLVGSFMQSRSIQAQYDAQAAQVMAQSAAYDANARIAEQNAQAALAAGEAAKKRQERIGKARQADRAVSYLKSGVALVGSPLAVLGDSAVQEALEAEDLLYEKQIQANQEMNQAKMQRFYSDQAKTKAQSIRDTGSSRVGASLLGSALRTFK